MLCVASLNRLKKDTKSLQSKSLLSSLEQVEVCVCVCVCVCVNCDCATFTQVRGSPTRKVINLHRQTRLEVSFKALIFTLVLSLLLTIGTRS